MLLARSGDGIDSRKIEGCAEFNDYAQARSLTRSHTHKHKLHSLPPSLSIGRFACTWMSFFSLGRLSLDWMYEVTPRTSLGTSWQPSLLLLALPTTTKAKDIGFRF